MRTRFKAWIVKYALSSGISEVEVEDCFHISPDMVSEVGRPLANFHKGEWFRTREEAAAKAEEMRAKRISSLEKQLKKMREISF